ncbi:MAG TPA: tetraacyldisaccharide 4'-kinase [Stellaceae bacterium]|nr:tetraacyldisaccharide 4'-kinase [Stellaceae bacterium]
MWRSAPEFWARDGVLPTLLAPLGWAYGAAGSLRRAAVKPYRAPISVICVGNLVAGGAGKTPVAIDLARRLSQSGREPHILTRGYGGALAGPVRVERGRHGYREVGDEALLLAAAAPTWVARNRAAGARAAVAAGARALILDDGFQNPSLAHDLDLLVIDGDYGFGNGRVIPAGPLREPQSSGLGRADAVVLLGDDRTGVSARLRDLPVLRARVVPKAAAETFSGRDVVAFAGIGRPEKFFRTLEGCGARVIACHAFPDHHAYEEAALDRLAAEAATAKARLVTTEKDMVRVPERFRAFVAVLPIEVEWADTAALEALLAPRLQGAPDRG